MHARSWTWRALAMIAVVAVISSGCAWTQRVSVDSAGNQSDSPSVLDSISGDGRYVVFETLGALVAGDTNGASDVYVRDTLAGTTTRISVATDGTGADAGSFNGDISPDGRYVAFESLATNLVAGAPDTTSEVFVRDTVSGTTMLVTVGVGGAPANGDSFNPSISADGQWVAFDSYATNLVAGDTDNVRDVFSRNMVVHTTFRESNGWFDTQPNGPSSGPQITDDGAVVFFNSDASNLKIPSTITDPDVRDSNGVGDVFWGSTGTDTRNFRISGGDGADQANGRSEITSRPASGSWFVAFVSEATNLVPGDTNGRRDVFLYSLASDQTTRVSVTGTGAQSAGPSDSPAVSGDGRYVAFSSSATDLVPGDTNDAIDVFVRDTVGGTTSRVSVTATGAQSAGGDSAVPAISADGRSVAFTTGAANLVAKDTNHENDVVVRANPQPAVTGITPSTLSPGTTTLVSIAGSGFVPGAVVVVDGSGTTVSDVTVVGPTEITAKVTAVADAPSGPRNVWIELPGTGAGPAAGAAGLCVGCLTVP
jgi:Tol biopolymer transport system component